MKRVNLGRILSGGVIFSNGRNELHEGDLNVPTVLQTTSCLEKRTTSVLDERFLSGRYEHIEVFCSASLVTLH